MNASSCPVKAAAIASSRPRGTPVISYPVACAPSFRPRPTADACPSLRRRPRERGRPGTPAPAPSGPTGAPPELASLLAAHPRARRASPLPPPGCHLSGSAPPPTHAARPPARRTELQESPAVPCPPPAAVRGRGYAGRAALVPPPLPLPPAGALPVASLSRKVLAGRSRAPPSPVQTPPSPGRG